MAQYDNPSSSEKSNSTAIIVLAMIVLAAIVLGAVYFMNYGVMNTNTTTIDRTVTRVEQIPVPVPSKDTPAAPASNSVSSAAAEPVEAQPVAPPVQ